MTERNTVQKQIITDAVKQMHSHPTAMDVYLHVKSNHPSISKSTVYRVLPGLAAKGEIVQMVAPRDLERYDGNNRPHYHFRCKTCGGIFDVNTDLLAALEKEVAQKYGHRVHGHEIIFWGTCSNCDKL